ncbi:MAG: TauD/TfdA family dioxygenase [Pseudobacteriovorax sp.]|nr:TauD/TfdA family dioxygenase [Pseudobacteriovorax sp.]
MRLNQLTKERSLFVSEYAKDAPTKKSQVLVLEPRSTLDYEDTLDLFQAEQQEIHRLLERRGAVLFRNFPIGDAFAAETLLGRLDIEMDTDYLGGVSPRNLLTQYTFTSTEAPAPFIISFHTEMCYLQKRPSRVVFFCLSEPDRYGETSIFDCAKIYQGLPLTIREKLEQHGLIYRRFNSSKPSVLNVNKTWIQAYKTESRDVVEAMCDELGMTYSWNEMGDLTTEAKLPGFLIHPITGKRCLNMTIYNEFAASIDLDMFRHRFNPILKAMMSRFVSHQFKKPNVFLKTLWGNGEPISESETREIIQTAWDNSTVFSWRQGDLLLLNNILYGHGRLNVKSPRKIAAALGNQYDITKSLSAQIAL